MSETTIKLIKGMQADYSQEVWPGVNTSGLTVYGNRVLIRMDQCAAATAGGVHLTEDLIEKMNMASESGCIYDIGDGAFLIGRDHREWRGRRPAVGERVYVERYAGVLCRGKDGATYRIMDDTCIAGGLTFDDAQGAEVTAASAAA